MTVQGVDEAEEYNHTIKAMHIMGISNDDIICKIYFILILLISLVISLYFIISHSSHCLWCITIR